MSDLARRLFRSVLARSCVETSYLVTHLAPWQRGGRTEGTQTNTFGVISDVCQGLNKKKTDTQSIKYIS